MFSLRNLKHWGSRQSCLLMGTSVGYGWIALIGGIPILPLQKLSMCLTGGSENQLEFLQGPVPLPSLGECWIMGRSICGIPTVPKLHRKHRWLIHLCLCLGGTSGRWLSQILPTEGAITIYLQPILKARAMEVVLTLQCPQNFLRGCGAADWLKMVEVGRKRRRGIMGNLQQLQ